MNQLTINYIINKYQNNFKSKYVFFELLHDLKTNVEFNSTLNYTELFKTLSIIYNDPKPIYNNDKFTPENITELNENEVFVFGSNTKGIHGAGAAKFAMKYGAIYGQAKGLQGQTYAIVTKDLDKGDRSIPLEDIESQVEDLIYFALDNKHLTFYVTKIGTNLGGYSIQDIAQLFANKIYPENIILPIEFVYPHYWAEFLFDNSTDTFYKVNKDNIIKIVNVKNEYSISTIKITNENYFYHMPHTVTVIEPELFEIAYNFVLDKLK